MAGVRLELKERMQIIDGLRAELKDQTADMEAQDKAYADKEMEFEDQ